MKTLIAAAILTVAAGAASATTFSCNFEPKLTRGWAPEYMRINNEAETVNVFGETSILRSQGEYNRFSVKLKTTKNKLIPVDYTLQIKEDGTNRAWMTISVNKGQNERSAGTCTKLY